MLTSFAVLPLVRTRNAGSKKVGIPVAKTPSMKIFAKGATIIQILICLASVRASQALTMNELRQIPNLSPQSLAKRFSEFEFKFRAEVQDHDVFLTTKSGDCDDAATASGSIAALARRAHTTRSTRRRCHLVRPWMVEPFAIAGTDTIYSYQHLRPTCRPAI